MIKVGDECPSGSIVNSILGQSSKAVVYTTEDEQLRWSYSDNGGIVPEKLSTAISTFDMLMSEIKTAAPEKHKKECFILLGKTLFAALNKNDADYNESHFDDFKAYLKKLAQQRSRSRYVLVCMVITSVFSVAILLLAHNVKLHHEVYVYATVFGAIGACVSVMQRVNTIDIDWKLHGFDLWLQAAIRVILGLLFGAIFILACKSDFLMGAFKDNLLAMYLLALTAGFSERMIPDLFGRLEIAGNKKA
jgi:hypothetical protein